MMKRKFHCIETKLRWNRGISLLASVCLLLGLAVATSCNETLTPDQFTDPMARELTLRFYLPGVAPSTKATVGPINSVSPESQIYNVRVWVFNHVDPSDDDAVAASDNEIAIAYTQVNEINWVNSENLPSGSNYYTAQYWADTYTLEVKVNFPGYIVGRDANDMKFDFYVLANAPSVGVAPNQLTKRGDLKNLTFGYTSSTDDLFGPYQQARATWGNSPAVAIDGGTSGTIGLPISGFFNKDKEGDPTGVDLSFLKNNTASLTPAQVADKLPIVQLERGVSKIRFFFAQPTGMTGASVTKIEILANQIPAQTYVFPRENGSFSLPDGVTYVDKIAEIPGPTSAEIVELSDPESLKSSSATYASAAAQAYEEALDAAVGTKVNTQRYVYLRETDQDLTCRISYKLSESGTVISEDFKLSDSPGFTDLASTNLHRNHYWTVYAYFSGDGLYIRPIVLPWMDGSSYTYTQRGSAVVAISEKKESLFSYGYTTSNSNPWWLANKDNPDTETEWYFRRQDPEYTDNWNYDWLHSQMVSAPGVNAGGAPIYANRIELRTNGFIVPLRLKLSNPDDFYIVTYNATSANYVSWTVDSQPAGYDETDGALIPLLISAGGTTYFYVVPKAGAVHEGKTTAAYLVTDPNDGSGSQKLPFNAGVFPGSNENTEINFYSVSVDTFQDYYDETRPVEIRRYDKDSWIDEP